MVNASRLLLVALTLCCLASPTRADDTDPVVRLYYVVPWDRPYRTEYRDAIRDAALEIQHFYAEQLDYALGFELADPVVEVVYGGGNSAYYAADMWNRAREEVGARFYDPSNLYVIYVDAKPDCGTAIGGGGGVAVLAENDLLGLTSQPTIPDCSGYRDDYPQSRWVGGLGHEIGHAFGLPHPAGCEADAPECPGDALMWTGYASYPDTYLTEADKAILRESPFFAPEEDHCAWRGVTGSTVLDGFQIGIAVPLGKCRDDRRYTLSGHGITSVSYQRDGDGLVYPGANHCAWVYNAGESYNFHTVYDLRCNNHGVVAQRIGYRTACEIRSKNGYRVKTAKGPGGGRGSSMCYVLEVVAD